MARWHHCPKCNRRLKQEGELVLDGKAMAVFQCDECMRKVEPFHDGVLFNAALTFCVDEEGSVIDVDED